MSMSIADKLRAYSQAYPIDIFPDCDRKQLKQLHIDHPHMSAHIWGEAGRSFARQALEGADELDRMEAQIEGLQYMDSDHTRSLVMIEELRKQRDELFAAIKEAWRADKKGLHTDWTKLIAKVGGK